MRLQLFEDLPETGGPTSSTVYSRGNFSPHGPLLGLLECPNNMAPGFLQSEEKDPVPL